MARRRFHPPARAPSRAKEVSPSRQSLREPPRRRPKSPARAATSSAAGKRGFLAFPRGQTERALLALASLASKQAKATNTAPCSPRAQPSPWAALANAPQTNEAKTYGQARSVLTGRGTQLLFYHLHPHANWAPRVHATNDSAGMSCAAAYTSGNAFLFPPAPCV
jgi:hypothetical protein